MLLYQQGFRFFNMGYASAMAVLLLVVAFAVTVVIIRNSRRWVHYAGRAMSTATVARRGAPLARRRPPAAVRRRRFLVAVADHSLLIVAGDRVPRAVRVHRR